MMSGRDLTTRSPFHTRPHSSSTNMFGAIVAGRLVQTNLQRM
jgi:hypothetical protein